MPAKDALRYSQLREDNREALTLFPADCQDEIRQTDMPIPPKPSDEPLMLTEGYFNILSGWKTLALP